MLPIGDTIQTPKTEQDLIAVIDACPATSIIVTRTGELQITYKPRQGEQYLMRVLSHVPETGPVIVVPYMSVRRADIKNSAYTYYDFLPDGMQITGDSDRDHRTVIQQAIGGLKIIGTFLAMEPAELSRVGGKYNSVVYDFRQPLDDIIFGNDLPYTALSAFEHALAVLPE